MMSCFNYTIPEYVWSHHWTEDACYIDCWAHTEYISRIAITHWERRTIFNEALWLWCIHSLTHSLLTRSFFRSGSGLCRQTHSLGLLQAVIDSQTNGIIDTHKPNTREHSCNQTSVILSDDDWLTRIGIGARWQNHLQHQQQQQSENQLRERARWKKQRRLQTSQRLLRPPLSRQSTSTACIHLFVVHSTTYN